MQNNFWVLIIPTINSKHYIHTVKAQRHWPCYLFNNNIVIAVAVMQCDIHWSIPCLKVHYISSGRDPIHAEASIAQYIWEMHIQEWLPPPFEFPTHWKIPVHKKGDVLDVNYYRPISVIPTVNDGLVCCLGNDIYNNKLITKDLRVYVYGESIQP